MWHYLKQFHVTKKLHLCIVWLCFVWYPLLLFFSHSVVSNSLRTHGLQHARHPCPSPYPRGYLNSCPLSWWCYPAILSSHLLPLLPSTFPSIRVFSNELAICIRWPQFWSFSFSISPSTEYSGLISFRIHWFDLLTVKGSQESSPIPQFESINSSALNIIYDPTLTSIHDY